MHVLTIIGTRPEAVKMAPVLRALAARRGVRSTVVSTGQHPDLLDEPLRFFGLAADQELHLMQAGEDPLELVARAARALAPLIAKLRPDQIIVQGDTASAAAGARAAALAGIPLAHVEAGLRTHGTLPWPEEAFRREIDEVADLLFAPTPLAANNLRAERLAGAIHLTGNSGIDALHFALRSLTEDVELRAACEKTLPQRTTDRPLILATLHRRESAGVGAAELCAALLTLVEAGLAEVVMPFHPNGAMAPFRGAFAARSDIHLVPPLAYPAMVRLMQHADLILTDSGGIQEEAPTLGKPVLVLRGVTERPEGVALGLAALVDLDRRRIVDAARPLLARRLQAVIANPYGDGRASERIVAGLLGEPFVAFGPQARIEPPVILQASA